MADSIPERIAALQDFDRSRKQAIIQELLAWLTNTPVDLLPFEEVRRKLHIQGCRHQGLQEVPLDKIVGSVGRYQDFTRTFLPRRSVNPRRWAQVKALAEGAAGWPPIEVFQVGDVYFVEDGNHRVSVALDLEMKTIQAYVTGCKSPVPLDASLTPMDLIVKTDYANFLESTHLDRLRPDQHIEFSMPGRYQDLLAHIAGHQHCLERRSGQAAPWEEAVTGWYDNVYLPLVRLIREKGMLEKFPHRTEADLYAWVTRHEMELREVYGVPDVNDEVAIQDLAEHYSERPIIAQLKAIQRAFRKLLGRKMV
jgi:hypothetical protein